MSEDTQDYATMSKEDLIELLELKERNIQLLFESNQEAKRKIAYFTSRYPNAEVVY